MSNFNGMIIPMGPPPPMAPMGPMGPMSPMGQMGQMGQMSQMGQMGQMSQMGQMGQMAQMAQMAQQMATGPMGGGQRPSQFSAVGGLVVSDSGSDGSSHGGLVLSDRELGDWVMTALKPIFHRGTLDEMRKTIVRDHIDGHIFAWMLRTGRMSTIGVKGIQGSDAPKVREIFYADFPLAKPGAGDLVVFQKGSPEALEAMAKVQGDQPESMRKMEKPILIPGQDVQHFDKVSKRWKTRMLKAVRPNGDIEIEGHRGCIPAAEAATTIREVPKGARKEGSTGATTGVQSGRLTPRMLADANDVAELTPAAIRRDAKEATMSFFNNFNMKKFDFEAKRNSLPGDPLETNDKITFNDLPTGPIPLPHVGVTRLAGS
eukprot:TRINITY_DN3295_c0_g2_i1.p1 TRINITY_DN3295_c0_g2~~TRINITY_DN3295_c0_g2_i1.p1  ORF type:complete len:373 (+),score=69.69 TRINITY_DN3295_c0_g2_i1:159-1277(+)